MKEITIQVATEPWRQMASGVGASWHSILYPPVGACGSAMGGSPPVIARHEELWQSMERYADWLALKFIRLEMEWRQFEPERGAYTWESPEMRILDRICQWAQSRGSDVMIQCSWINADWCCFPEFVDDPALKVYSAPSDIDAWAKSWVALLHGLVVERGYHCVRWINLVNEPCCAWWYLPGTENAFGKTHDEQMAYLGKATRAIRDAIRAAGLPVKVMGPGETDLPVYDTIVGEAWFDAVDDVDFHSYCSNFDYDDPDEQPVGKNWGYRIGQRLDATLAKYVKEANAAGKGLYLTEFGTQTYGYEATMPGPNSFKATLKDTEMLIRCLNLGLDGLSHWSFVNRGDLDGQWQFIDTWSSWPKQWLPKAKPHPWSFHVLGLATRHLPAHAKIYQTVINGSKVDGIPRVWSVACRSPKDDSFTMLIVNDLDEPFAATIEGAPRKLWRLTASEDQPPESALIYHDETSGTATLAPFSLTILTDRQLKEIGRF